MKTRIVQVVIVLVVILIVSAGTANADWWVDLVCADNPSGPAGSHFEVRYHEDGGETDTWTAIGFYLETHGATGTNDITTTPNMTEGGAFYYSTGFPPSDWNIVAFDEYDDNTAQFSMYWSGGLSTAPDPSDGDLIFVCDYNAPLTGNVEWDNSPGDFLINIGDQTTRVDYYWTDFVSGGNLRTNSTPATSPEDEDPVPPVPEFITAALLTIGLVAICGYIWYFRSSGFTFAR